MHVHFVILRHCKELFDSSKSLFDDFVWHIVVFSIEEPYFSACCANLASNCFAFLKIIGEQARYVDYWNRLKRFLCSGTSENWSRPALTSGVVVNILFRQLTIQVSAIVK